MSKKKRHTGRLVRTLMLGFLLAALAGQASAQDGWIDRLFGKKNQTEGEGADSVQKERKPLESYFFGDSIRQRMLFSWTMRPGFNQIDTLAIDTLLHRFEIDYPFMRPDVGSEYLGNLGGAARRMNYLERPVYRDFSFLEAYDSYLITPERVPFFNVKRPYSNLSYTMAGQTKYLEQHLRITHAQNISPSTGFNIHYLNRKTWGLYSSQKATDKNFSFAFSHTGKRYSIHAGYLYNMGDITENGGIVWDNSLADQSIKLPENIPVRLSDNSAKNEFKANTFYLNQAYGIPLQRVTDADLSIADKSSLFVGHAFEYTSAYRKYTDTHAGATYQKGDPKYEYRQNAAGANIVYPEDPNAPHNVNYYPFWFDNPEVTLDSLREHRLDNKVYVQIQPWNRDGIVGTIDAGIGHTFLSYELFDPRDYLVKRKRDKETDTYIYGAVHGKLRRYVDWQGTAQYHIAGLRSQDFRIGGQLSLSAYIRQRPITLTVSAQVDNRTPDYWTQTYRSNHYIWNNDFSKENELRLEARLEVPSIGLEAGAWHSTTTDKIYYGYVPKDKILSWRVQNNSMVPDRDSLVYDVAPLQHSGTLSVTGFYLMKNFKLGILNLNHRVLVQKSSDEEVVSLPLASAQASYFVDFNLVRNVLHMQIGLSGFYHTEYYAPGYNPALMKFHNQNFYADTDDAGNHVDMEKAKKLGNYPYMDFFVAAKWKRMRILAKLQHVNKGLFGDDTYFGALHYPMNGRMFKLGISWSFYD